MAIHFKKNKYEELLEKGYSFRYSPTLLYHLKDEVIMCYTVGVPPSPTLNSRDKFFNSILPRCTVVERTTHD